MRLIDTHCHFDNPAFDNDRTELVQTMQAAGVTDVIFPAITADSWPRLREITATSRHFHASYGLHPMFIDQHLDKHIILLHQWLRQEPVVAVGECGLDFFVPGLDKARQLAIFDKQLYLAREFDLPLIIHARKSLDIVLKHIRRIGALRGVIHSFAGSQQQVDQLVAQGFYLGIGGTVTYERARRLRRIVTHLPRDRLLLETDAPDQPDSAWRGKRNDPTRLPVMATAIAELWGETVLKVAETTTHNAQRLFRLP